MPTTAPAEAPGLEALLDYLRESRGFDFSAYKRSTLERRIQKRMGEAGIESYADYQDQLEVTPGEFTELFNTILINVTGFFRDPQAWEFLASDVLPRVAEQIPDDRAIRVWSAACSSGEEAYTAAMLLAEQLGLERFRKKVKIYATDVDDDALAAARQGTFPSESLESIPPPLLEKYFEPHNTGHVFKAALRRSIIFGRNDLVQDAPISHIDLLISRNALMYFTREAQSHVLGNFNFALHDDGFLFLGKSEMLLTHTDLFTPYELKWRVFRKVQLHGYRERLPAVDGPGSGASSIGDVRARGADAVPVAHVVVDRGGFVVMISERARQLFTLGPADVGRPLHDLEISYRPLDLRSALEQVEADNQPAEFENVDWTGPDGVSRTLSARIVPVGSPNGPPLGFSITFEDVSDLARLGKDHDQAQRRLEDAYEELQSTVEELETTNEELQSTNEELETTNEELQSTNEELETMNEELQSTNDELEAMNDEQRTGARELNRLNVFLERILGDLDLGVVVLDAEKRVQIWNSASQELWGVRPDEAEGQPFLALDIGIPVAQLAENIDRALAVPPMEGELTVDAVNRKGRRFRCTVRTVPLSRPDASLEGMVILMGDSDSDGSLWHRASRAPTD